MKDNHLKNLFDNSICKIKSLIIKSVDNKPYYESDYDAGWRFRYHLEIDDNEKKPFLIRNGLITVFVKNDMDLRLKLKKSDEYLIRKIVLLDRFIEDIQNHFTKPEMFNSGINRLKQMIERYKNLVSNTNYLRVLAYKDRKNAIYDQIQDFTNLRMMIGVPMPQNLFKDFDQNSEKQQSGYTNGLEKIISIPGDQENSTIQSFTTTESSPNNVATINLSATTDIPDITATDLSSNITATAILKKIIELASTHRNINYK